MMAQSDEPSHNNELSVMVIIIGNGIGYSSSNPRQSC